MKIIYNEATKGKKYTYNYVHTLKGKEKKENDFNDALFKMEMTY